MTVCRSCKEPAPPGTNWCEACGADLDAAVAPCADCGADGELIDELGYCGRCGSRAGDTNEHHEHDLGRGAGVTHKGLRHHRNEDAFALGVSPAGDVVVVCDGVGSTDNPHLASRAAADAALAVLTTAVREGADPVAATTASVRAAQDAARAVPGLSDSSHAPSSTIVTAVVLPGEGGPELTVGWLGDSRAYWFSAETAHQLTTDHAQGRSITRWLGADALDVDPQIHTERFPGPGRLLVCSDGLWNHADDPEDLALVATIGSPAESARSLLQLALDGGGHDNITVVCVDTA